MFYDTFLAGKERLQRFKSNKKKYKHSSKNSHWNPARIIQVPLKYTCHLIYDPLTLISK